MADNIRSSSARVRVPWTGPFVLPTTDKSQVPADTSPLQVAQKWLADFAKALDSHPSAVVQLFLEDGFWRDLLAVSWDFRSIQGAGNILEHLETHLLRSGLRSFTLAQDPLRGPVLRSPLPDLTFVQFCFNFENAVGKGSGTCRLVCDSDDKWKAYTMFTGLDALDDFPGKVGALRDSKVYQGTWRQKRLAEMEFADDHPTVVIIGAGHSGLEVAARLQSLGVLTLVIERSARVGDNWRNRYETLCLHDPVWYDQMPYLPFPSSWPVYPSAPKLGDWFENYASSLDLNIWTSSEVKGARWDDPKKGWTLNVRRGNSDRTLQANHLVFATGLGGGVPKIPAIPGREVFEGRVLHSSEFTTAKEYAGLKVVVVGACNSANDIAYDFSQRGADVTMFQRSSTFVISAKAISAMLGGLGVLIKAGTSKVQVI
ncbi:hypothetical protein AcW1_010059 [Taiwanofungus camphoratus]|nr:hypothetical protein AcW1_010059 [Antrodia cinnamomea]